MTVADSSIVKVLFIGAGDINFGEGRKEVAECTDKPGFPSAPG